MLFSVRPFDPITLAATARRTSPDRNRRQPVAGFEDRAAQSTRLNPLDTLREQ